VLFLNDAQMAGTGAVGFCDLETQTIGVVGSQSDDSMRDTFLHEVFHAIVHVMDLKETETEENYVRRLATGLVAHPTSTTAAIVVIRRCFISLQLLILHPSWLRVCGGGR